MVVTIKAADLSVELVFVFAFKKTIFAIGDVIPEKVVENSLLKFGYSFLKNSIVCSYKQVSDSNISW